MPYYVSAFKEAAIDIQLTTGKFYNGATIHDTKKSYSIQHMC